jgi:DUF4097 and DUF4098 domain-containing protein YvlB
MKKTKKMRRKIMETNSRTNTQTIPVQNIDTIYVQYQADSITVRKTDGNELILNEHLFSDEAEYDAEVAVSGGRVTIKNGKRPESFYSFHKDVHIDIFIPGSYAKDVHISSQSGSIHFKDDFEFTGKLEVDSQSGSIGISELNGPNQKVSAASGSMGLGRVNGSGVFSTSSGSIALDIGESKGQLEAKASSGSISIQIPKGFVPTVWMPEVRAGLWRSRLKMGILWVSGETASSTPLETRRNCF